MAENDFHAEITGDTRQLNSELGETRQGMNKLLDTFEKLESQIEGLRKTSLKPWLDQVDKAVQKNENLTRSLTNLQKANSMFGSRLGTQGVQSPYHFAKNSGANASESLAMGRYLQNSYTASTPGAIEAQLKQHTQKIQKLLMSTTNEVMDAQLMAYGSALKEQVRRAGTPGLYQAQATIRQRNDAYTMRRAEIGDDRAGWERRYQSLNSDGGSDLMAVQARVMVGYQALSGAFNIARGLSTFVVQLDKEFKQFQAITNTTSEEMVQVRKDLIDVSEATKFTALEVAEAATIMGQAGLSAQNVREAIESVTLLATASGSTLNEAVETVTSTLSIFNLQADQATQIANTFTAALNGSKLSMDKITLGLQYAGNTAAQFGVTYQELTAALGAMANSGIKSGSTLGTGMRQLLVELEVPSKKFAAQLEDVGLSVSDVDVRTRGLIPVLKSLKDAGFGASEAYKSFEIRSAAAFSALSNNLTLAEDLEGSFYKSTAALKANEVQMESLANTWSKFQSVVGTLAYDFFAPVLAVFQDVIEVSANLLSGFREYPQVLQAAGAAVAGLGTAMAVSLAAVTTKGLFKGLFPIAGFGAAATSVGALGTAAAVAAPKVTMLGRALQVVFMAFKANWVSLGIGAGVAIYSLFKAFSDGATDAEKQLAKIEAVSSRAKQALDTFKQEASAVDQTITNLRARQEELDNDPIQRQLKIDEVLAQFGELRGTIDSSVSSVQDLINALGDLKGFSLESQQRTLTEFIEAEKLKVVAEQSLRGEMGVDPAVRDTGWRSREFGTRLERGRVDSVVGSLGFSSTELKSVQGFSDILLRGLRDPANASSVEGFTDAMQSLNTILSKLEARELSGEITPSQKALLETLNELKEVANPYVTSVLRQEEAQRQIKTGEGEATRLRLDTEITRATDAGGAGLVKNLRDQTNTLLDVLSSSSAARPAAEQAYNDLEDRLTAIDEAYEKFIDGIAVEGADRAMIESVFGQSETGKQFFEQRKRVNDQLEAQAEELGKADERRAKEDVARSKKFLSQAQKRLGQAKNEADRVTAEADLIKMMDQKAEAERRLLVAQLANAETGIERSDINTKFAEDQALALEERETALAEAKQKQIDLELDRYNQMIDTANGQVKLIEDEIALLTEELSRTDSASEVGRLQAAISGLLGKLTEAVTIRQNLMLGQEGVTSGNGESLYGHLVQSESSGQTNITNSRGAMGRVQFMPSTLNRFRAANPAFKDVSNQEFLESKEVQKVAEQWWFNTLRNYIASNGLLERFGGQTIKGVKIDESALIGMAHLGGEGGMKRFLETGGAYDPDDAIGPKVGTRLSDYGKKFGGYNPDVAAFYNSGAQQQIETDAASRTETEAEVAKAAQEAAANMAKIALERAATDADRTLDVLLSNAQLSNDPAAIQAMVAQADETATSLMAKQLQAFDEGVDPSTPEANALERKKLQDDLIQQRNQKVSSLLDEYNRAVDAVVTRPLEEAQARLTAAQESGNYSPAELTQLQNDVDAATKAENASRYEAAQSKLAVVQNLLAEATRKYGENSSSAAHWTRELAEAQREAEAAGRGLQVQQAAANHTAAGSPQQRGFEQWYGEQTQFVDPATREIRSAQDQMADNWYTIMGGMQSASEQFFMSMGQGWSGMKEGAKAAGLSIINMLQQMIAKAMAFQLVMALFGKPGSPTGLGKVFNVFAGMGGVPGAATGELITTGIPGRDSTLRMVEPGEMILRRSAVQAIGEDKLLEVNNMGNNLRSPSGFVNPQKSEGEKTVNVYVVSPDEKPQMTENDVLLVMSRDMQNRGPTYKLVKSIQMGQI